MGLHRRPLHEGVLQLEGYKKIMPHSKKIWWALSMQFQKRKPSLLLMMHKQTFKKEEEILNPEDSGYVTKCIGFFIAVLLTSIKVIWWPSPDINIFFLKESSSSPKREKKCGKADRSCHKLRVVSRFLRAFLNSHLSRAGWGSRHTQMHL